MTSRIPPSQFTPLTVSSPLSLTLVPITSLAFNFCRSLISRNRILFPCQSRAFTVTDENVSSLAFLNTMRKDWMRFLDLKFTLWTERLCSLTSARPGKRETPPMLARGRRGPYWLPTQRGPHCCGGWKGARRLPCRSLAPDANNCLQLSHL